MVRNLKIGTRGSPLALWQAEWVREQLQAVHPEIQIELVTIRTQGDLVLDTPLPLIGGKGLFTSEIERALRNGEIDLAVHSLKDLPTSGCEGLELAAICERADPRDALIARGANLLRDLPEGATVATGSMRRAAQVLHLRPDLRIAPLRGNVGTRLRKFDESEWDAMLLAHAGLERLGMESRISAILEPAEILPAPSQGAIAVQIHAEAHRVRMIVSVLDHLETRQAVTAERAFLQKLEGGCQAPIAALAAIENDWLTLDGLIASPDGKVLLRDRAEGNPHNAENIGQTLAERLLQCGGKELIAHCGTNHPSEKK
ncbi:TPA: hydroxymethylbilane synthase [Candidatus Sumerlaeota bacterium]|nr:hydroxymethylbilane synthase [Candidatus Sumerlaeota bacterium]